MNYQNTILNNLWFPFTCSADVVDYPPIIMQRGSGIYLYDENGKAYIDAISSWWTNILGHCNERISSAIAEQASTLEHVIMAGCISQTTIELTQLLREILPQNLTRIFYSDDGSTAVEVALKLALQYWKIQDYTKNRFISFDGAYHGDTLGAMLVGSISQYHSLFQENMPQHFRAEGPYCYRCIHNKEKETCDVECMRSLETLLKENNHSIAACIIEPMVQGAAGMRIYPAKVLNTIFSLCKKYDVLLIADEVMVGFGRTGKMFGCDHVQGQPDMLCCAKGLTGGYMPLAVTAVTEKIYNAFRGTFKDNNTFYHGHSYTGNPLGCAAARACLQILKEENIPYSLQEKMDFFHSSLETFAASPIIGDVRSIGMIGALELVLDKKNKTPFPSDKRIPFRICQSMKHKGVLARPLGNVLYFIPPYTITLKEIETMLSIAYESINEFA